MPRTLQKYSDVLLAVAFALAATIEILGRGATPHAVVVLALGAVGVLSLIWRARWPVGVLAVNLGVSLALELITGPDDYPVALGLVLPVTIYSAAAHTLGRNETIAGGLLVASVPILTGAHALDYNWPDPGASTNVAIGFVFLTIIFRGAWLAGKWNQNRRAKQQALLAKRAEQAREALREERARIARELHDVLAHAISVIVLQARGARHALADPPQEASDAIDAIERTASQALGEMRRLLTVLRVDDSGAALTPQPSLARIDSLIGEVRAAGLPVKLQVEGNAHEVPAGIDLCAYRIVQEALTNALKHAAGATAEVVVRYGDHALDIEVTDTGIGHVNGSLSGLGLAGMAERVALFGGEFENGPRPDRGYFVRARLPL
jgi:signal transduction histidine kinase